MFRVQSMGHGFRWAQIKQSVHGDASEERGDAVEAQVESRRSKRKLKSRRALRDAITELRESQKAALAAVAAEAADQVADLRSMITQLHNQLVDAVADWDHHEEVTGRGAGGGDVEDKAARKERMAAWKDPTVRKTWLRSGEKPAMASWTSSRTC